MHAIQKVISKELCVDCKKDQSGNGDIFIFYLYVLTHAFIYFYSNLSFSVLSKEVVDNLLSPAYDLNGAVLFGNWHRPKQRCIGEDSVGYCAGHMYAPY